MSDFVLKFKGEPKKIKNKTVIYNLYLLAHKGSGFDSYVVINNLTQRRTVVSLIKNGSGIVSLELFNGYVNQLEKHLIMFILVVVHRISKTL